MRRPSERTAERSRRSGEGGFTLIELLVSLAVGLLLTILLVAVLRGALAVWIESSDRLAAQNQARTVLDQVERDLTAALWSDDGRVGLAATILTGTELSGWWEGGARTKPASADSLRLGPEQIEHCRFGVGGTWLRVFTATTTDGAGAVRAVGYQLIRRELAAGSGEFAYLLHRAEVSPAQTFAAGYDLDPAAGGYRERSATSGHAGNLLRPPLTSVLGDHVVDFGVRLYRFDGDERRRLFPRGGQLEHLADAPDERPQVAEVMVRILDEQGVRRLAAFEGGEAPKAAGTTWWELVEAHSRVYVRWIALRAGD